MNDRRDFLKLFGVGCAVIPIIGGTPMFSSEARIVEPPKVEIVDSLTTLGQFNSTADLKSGQYAITVMMENAKGRRSIIQAQTFVLSVDIGVHEVKGRGYIQDAWLAAAEKKVTWKMEGQCFPDASNEILRLTELD